jgi:hypothetical protein
MVAMQKPSLTYSLMVVTEEQLETTHKHIYKLCINIVSQ